VNCKWVEFGHIDLDGDQTRRVAACRFSGKEKAGLYKPEGWSFEHSLSASFGFAPTREADRALRFLRHEKGLDVYLSELSGDEVYIGRTSGESS
jgi:hypothetical protein